MREGVSPPWNEENTEAPFIAFRDHLTYELIKAAEEMSREWERVSVGDVVT